MKYQVPLPGKAAELLDFLTFDAMLANSLAGMALTKLLPTNLGAAFAFGDFVAAFAFVTVLITRVLGALAFAFALPLGPATTAPREGNAFAFGTAFTGVSAEVGRTAGVEEGVGAGTSSGSAAAERVAEDAERRAAIPLVC